MPGDLHRSEHVPEHAGDGPIVVFVHGSMDRGAAFARVAGHLRDLHTIRYDRRGYGRSVELGAPDLHGHVDDLIDVIDGRPAVVVGHSLGGLIALAGATQRPDLVRAVVTYEAPTPWASWWPSRSAGGVALEGTDPGDVAERFLRRMIGDERWDGLPDGARADRRAEGVALAAELRSARLGAPYELGALDMPVVVADGTESRSHHIEGAQALAELLDTEPVVIQGANHGAHVTHHEQFAALIRMALEGQVPR